MFTGIIQAIGQVTSFQKHNGLCKLGIYAKGLEIDKIGESVAVNGVCLTVTAYNNGQAFFDLSSETVDRTSFSSITVGDSVNIEQALLPTTRISGHLVTGHIDAVGKVSMKKNNGDCVCLAITVPDFLGKYIAKKGSICVDGVSLTVNAVDDLTFEVLIIPHTLNETTLGQVSEDSVLNLEVDIFARYIERLVSFSSGENINLRKISAETLADAGFIGINVDDIGE